MLFITSTSSKYYNNISLKSESIMFYLNKVIFFILIIHSISPSFSLDKSLIEEKIYEQIPFNSGSDVFKQS